MSGTGWFRGFCIGFRGFRRFWQKAVKLSRWVKSASR
jgi:hypothetical protein